VAYERPALSKAYLFPEAPARLPGFHTTVGGGGERQEHAWYTDHGIAYYTSTRIESVDVVAHKLTTDEGVVFSYEKLVVATGARVRAKGDRIAQLVQFSKPI
jgi:monodehydroascorbate reductase (NADH)